MDLQCKQKLSSKYDLQCKNCFIDFSTIPLLENHYKEVCGFECSVCKKGFDSEKNFNQHISRYKKKCPKHAEEYGEEERYTGVRCNEDKCPEKKLSFSCLKIFRQHLAKAHGIEVPATKYEFSSNEEFLHWKSEIERMQGNETSYVIHSGSSTNTKQKKTCQKYYCNRSGVFLSTGYGKRKLKKQGSLKQGFYCTSSLETVTENGIIYVKFFKKHYGHETGLSNWSPNSSPNSSPYSSPNSSPNSSSNFSPIDENPYITGTKIQNQPKEEILEENIQEEINVDTMASSQRDIILNLMDDIEIKVHDEYSNEVFDRVIKQLKCVSSLLNTASLPTEYLETFSNSERIVDVPVKKKILSHLSQGSKNSESEAFHCAKKKLKPSDSCSD